MKNETLREKEWNAVGKVIRYLNSTYNFNLIINIKMEHALESYANATGTATQKPENLPVDFFR